MNITNDVSDRKVLYIQKTKHPLWRCLALVKCVYTVVQLVTILSSQLNCNTVYALLQELIAKGGHFMYIFRAWITRKDGTRDYAKNHGKRAFRIWIGPGPEPEKEKNR